VRVFSLSHFVTPSAGRWIAGLAGIALLLASCKRGSKTASAEPKPAQAMPAVADAPTPTPTPLPARAPSTSSVAVLGYHRFENPPHDSLAISTKEFETQMQRLKDSGVTVISMDDFLAWRRGEKDVPGRSAIITIDDGYISGYSEAWPILKKFGYPFTMFVYTNYIGTGGKSISWQQLIEMREAGVEIGSHTVSHDRLTAKKGKGRTEADYDAWLWNEVNGSKEMLESRLGAHVRTLAFPYGLANEQVKAVASKAGYQAQFTVNPIKTQAAAPAPDSIGRFIVESTQPKIFEQAANFGSSAPAVATTAMAAAQPASAAMVTQPMEGETVATSLPLIKANLAVLGKIDPKTVEMQLSGFGPVPATYDPASGLISFQTTQKIRDRSCTVTVTAIAAGKKVSTRWSFNVEPQAN
jgi:peptidoglycan/xylan/chitin deacetylase (PgdA/CDA1 family)